MQASAAPLRSQSEIPRTGLWWILTHALSAGGGRIDMLSDLRQLHAQHGKVVLQDVGLIKMINLFGPDANRFVLLDRDRIFSARRPWDMIMGKIFPNGLLLRDGDDHKHHRKIMHEAFKRSALASYAERMNPMIERGIGNWNRSTPLLAFRAFKQLTLDIAVSIFVGVDAGAESRGMNRSFEDMVAASMSRIRLPLPGLEFYRGLQGRKGLASYFRRLIPMKREGNGEDMFSRLCHAVSEEGDRLADAEIVDHMIFLMMAAHDTTTSTLTSMTYELAKNPEWQERIRRESLALNKAQMDFEDLEKLESLTWAMKETIRRYPPLPVIPRIATDDFEFEGYRIERNTMVVVSPIHTHHMEEWWTEPFRFDPERFAPGRAEDERHTHAWVPFGGGAHLCIGLRFAEVQVKAIMHQLVQRYRWSVPEGYTMPVQQAPISKPLDGLPVTFSSIV